MTLGARITASAGRPSARPFQRGRVLGTKSGVYVERDVDWLVDTGAEITTVLASVGATFDAVEHLGVSASPTTGGGGIRVVTGMIAEFTASDRAGTTRPMRAMGYVGIKSADTLNNLLGMHQLAQTGVSVTWDPAAGTGTLRS